MGDGGAVRTDDEVLAARVRRLSNLGQTRKGAQVEFGYSERLDALQAAILRVKLPYLEVWNEARRSHAARYASYCQKWCAYWKNGREAHACTTISRCACASGTRSPQRLPPSGSRRASTTRPRCTVIRPGASIGFATTN